MINFADDEPMQFQHARPVTLKRADIKKQLQNTVSIIISYMHIKSIGLICNEYDSSAHNIYSLTRLCLGNISMAYSLSQGYITTLFLCSLANYVFPAENSLIIGLYSSSSSKCSR